MIQEVIDCVGVELAEAALEGGLPHDTVHVLENQALSSRSAMFEVVIRDQMFAEQVGPYLASTGFAHHCSALLLSLQFFLLFILGKINKFLRFSCTLVKR